MKGANSRFGRKFADQSVGGAPVADGDTITLVSGVTTVLSDRYRTTCNTAGTATNEVVQLPAPTVVGQRKLVAFGTEGNASDVVRINAGSGDKIVTEGFVVSASGYAETLATNVDLTAPAGAALFEYRGVSGSTDAWNLVYTTGGVTVS